jgi:pimeloyl-ACP methyl ester carboxylesterase
VLLNEKDEYLPPKYSQTINSVGTLSRVETRNLDNSSSEKKLFFWIISL